MVTIRRATLKDFKSIQELVSLLIQREYKEWDKTLDLKWAFKKRGVKYLKKRIKDKKNSLVLVAIEDNKIVGCRVGAITKPEDYRIPEKYAEAEFMFVLPEFRNKGIGTKMINVFIKWCKERGVKRIKVVVDAHNKKAHKFDRKKGFKDYTITFEKGI